jgi:transcription factor STE12
MQVHYRHRRTHEQQQNGETIIDVSEEDMDGGDGVDDGLLALDEESPVSDHAYLTNSGLSSSMPHMSPAMSTMNTGTPVNTAAMNGTSMGPPQMVSAQNY